MLSVGKCTPFMGNAWYEDTEDDTKTKNNDFNLHNEEVILRLEFWGPNQ